MVEAYDPLNYENLARSVVNALLEAEAVAMPPVSEFSGSGVYALYYLGGLPFYEGIASRQCHPHLRRQGGAGWRAKGRQEQRRGRERRRTVPPPAAARQVRRAGPQFASRRIQVPLSGRVPGVDRSGGAIPARTLPTGMEYGDRRLRQPRSRSRSPRHATPPLGRGASRSALGRGVADRRDRRGCSVAAGLKPCLRRPELDRGLVQPHTLTHQADAHR